MSGPVAVPFHPSSDSFATPEFGGITRQNGDRAAQSRSSSRGLHNLRIASQVSGGLAGWRGIGGVD